MRLNLGVLATVWGPVPPPPQRGTATAGEGTNGPYYVRLWGQVRVAYKRVSEDASSCSPLRGGGGGSSGLGGRSAWLPPWCPGPAPDDASCRALTLRALIVTTLFMSGLVAGYLIRRAVTSSPPLHCTSGRPMTSSAGYQVLKSDRLTGAADSRESFPPCVHFQENLC